MQLRMDHLFLYRYEQSGELHGMTRVRGFTQGLIKSYNP